SFVQAQIVRPFPRPPPRAGHPDAVQGRLPLGALVPLSGAQMAPQRPPPPVEGEVQLRREPAPAPTEGFPSERRGPLFSAVLGAARSAAVAGSLGAGPGSRSATVAPAAIAGVWRAPAACWW